MSETRVLELQQGAGEPGALELRAGVQLPPVGIGSSGSWKVLANGILGIHAYIYYDGNALFVQSADERNPALVDGRAVGCTWTPVPIPCTISLAAARLVLRDVSATIDDEDNLEQEEDRTVAVSAASLLDEDRTLAVAAPPAPPAALPPTLPPPPPAPPAPRSVRLVSQSFGGPASDRRPPPPSSHRPFAPGAFVTQPDGESTRLQPIDEPEPEGDATRIVPLGEPLAETPPMGSPLPRMPFRPAPVRPAAGRRWAEARPSQPSLPELANDSQEELSTLPKEFPPPPPPDANDTPLVEPAMPVGLLNVPPPPVPVAPKGPTFGERLAKEWRETPPIKKVLVFLMPFMLPVVWFTFGDEPPPPHRVGGSASASAAGPQVPTTGTVQPYPYPTQPPGYPPAPASAAGVGYPTAPPTTTAYPTAPPTTTAYPTAPPTTDPAAGHTRPPSDATAKPTTPDPAASAAPVDRREHQAADLVATGQYEQAAQIYDRLGAEHPENPAFHEASRILRAKLNAVH